MLEFLEFLEFAWCYICEVVGYFRDPWDLLKDE